MVEQSKPNYITVESNEANECINNVHQSLMSHIDTNLISTALGEILTLCEIAVPSTPESHRQLGALKDSVKASMNRLRSNIGAFADMKFNMLRDELLNEEK